MLSLFISKKKLNIVLIENYNLKKKMRFFLPIFIFFAFSFNFICCEYANCLNELKALTKSSNLSSFILNSGNNVNDLGSFDACKKNPATRFFLISAVNDMYSLNLAFCVTKECNAQDVRLFLKENGFETINGVPVQVLETDEQNAKLDSGAAFVIVIIGLYLII